MSSILYKNELIKRKYFKYVRNAKGFSEKTIECYEKAIWLWEDFTGNADFANFNQTTAEGFKKWLKVKKKANSEEEVGVSYRYDMLRYLKTFFEWLSKQKGYRKIDQTAIEYLKLSKAEAKIATQPRRVDVPSVRELKTVMEGIQDGSEVEKRDRALISLIFLTGARISAVRTLQMKSFNKDDLIIDQNPAFGVETKFSKRIITRLISYPYEKSLEYFIEWFEYLESERKFKPEDPIFPATKITSGSENLSYQNTGQVKPVFWQSSSSPRNIIEKRFEEAGIKHYKPHSIRHSLVQRLSILPLTEEQKKAISQNMGHEDVRTTFGSYGYGKIDEEKQVEIIKNINFEHKNQEPEVNLSEESLQRLAEKIAKFGKF